MLFKNRRQAGQELASRLRHLRGTDVVVLALPRGGVPVAFEIAEALDAPLDLLFVRKIGVPGNEELAAGALVDGNPPEIVLNTDIIRAFGIGEAYLEEQVRRLRDEIARRRGLYLPGRPPVDRTGRVAVVVDDGIATGATVTVALRALAGSGAARRVLAVPVAPPDVAQSLQSACDEVIIPSVPAHFRAVGQFYEDFRPTPDAEIIALLHQHWASHPKR